MQATPVTEDTVDHPTQPVSPSQALAGVQTTSQAEEDLVLAQQGQVPVSAAAFSICKAITCLLHQTTDKAREGNMMSAERDIFMVRH